MTDNYCKECGKFIEAGAKFCNKCGATINQDVEQNKKDSGKLIIRRKSSILGAAVGIKVTLNGTDYTFTNGTEMSFDLNPGTYTVSWKFWCRSLQKTDVVITSGNTCLVELVYDWLWGGFKLGKNSKIN